MKILFTHLDESRASSGKFVSILVIQFESQSGAKILFISPVRLSFIRLLVLFAILDFDFLLEHIAGHSEIIETKTEHGGLVRQSWGQNVFA